MQIMNNAADRGITIFREFSCLVRYFDISLGD